MAWEEVMLRLKHSPDSNLGLPKRKRPFGVLAVIGLQFIFLSVFAFDLGRALAGQSSLLFPGIENRQAVLFVDLGIILMQLVIIFGLWRLQIWAWFLIMIQIGVSMTGDLVRYFSGDPFYPTMLLNILMVFYLNQREIQQTFESRTELR
jgi:uncharacterized membrane protein (DUF2068 family)